jgi:hypothetical protein
VVVAGTERPKGISKVQGGDGNNNWSTANMKMVGSQIIRKKC